MVAQLNSSLLIVSVVSLAIPTAFVSGLSSLFRNASNWSNQHQFLESRLSPGTEVKILLELSRGSAIILILIYVAYVCFLYFKSSLLSLK
jgi:Ca2+:H+ antiporter